MKKAVINLQLPGEHAYCGDGAPPGGYSYAPASFACAGIEVHELGWPDMTVRTFFLPFFAIGAPQNLVGLPTRGPEGAA